MSASLLNGQGGGIGSEEGIELLLLAGLALSLVLLLSSRGAGAGDNVGEGRHNDGIVRYLILVTREDAMI